MSTVQIHKLNEATLRIVSEDSGALRGIRGNISPLKLTVRV